MDKMQTLKLTSNFGKEQSVLGLLFCLLIVANLNLAMAQQEVQRVETRNHVFANKLYQVISEEHSGGKPTNLIFSPLSLEIVLAVAGLGARGNTSRQISQGIGLPLELSVLRNRYAPLLAGIEDDSGCILRIATQIFVEKDYPIKEEFVNASAEGFGCGTQSVEFAAEPDKALSTINNWAEEKTERLIKNLLERSAITPYTRLVLVNAVYFKGKWAHKFNPESTRKETFYLADGNTVDVDMMHIEKSFRFGHPNGLDAKVLELPYQGGQLSMVILLPDSPSGIDALEGKVSAEAFDMDGLISNHTSKVEVAVSLPKFKLELTTNLEASLAKLGMTDMFSDLADFSGMTHSKAGLKVSKVVQKAFIEVTEEGTEAAAATGVLMRSRRSINRDSFKADRPFVFFVADMQQRTVLFIGTCKNFSTQVPFTHEEL